MKIVALNIWGGRAGRDGILDFFDTHKEVDVFCLQEVWSAPYEHMEGTLAGGALVENKKAMTEGLQDISKVLNGHVGYFCPLFENDYGMLMMISNAYTVIATGDECVYMHRGYASKTEPGDHARLLQYITLERDGKLLTVINFHGLWVPKPEASEKRDVPERIEQSKKIVAFLKQFDHPVVLAGDFNLKPGTKSVKILEQAGLRNLVTEHNVVSTRTSFYTKPEKHADFIFVSEGVDVKDFKVLPDEISDHSPLYVEIV